MPAACQSACRTLRDVVPEEERPFRKDGRRSIRFPMASVILRWSSFRLHCPRSGPSIRERRERVSWFDQIPPPACIAPDRPVTSARSFTSAARQLRRRADRSARDRMPALPQTGMNPRPYALERPMHTLFWLRTDLRAHDNPALAAAAVTARSQRCSSQRPDNGNCMATRRPRSTSGCATCMRVARPAGPAHPLKLLTVNDWREAPDAIARFCADHGIARVHANAEWG